MLWINLCTYQIKQEWNILDDVLSGPDVRKCDAHWLRNDIYIKFKCTHWVMIPNIHMVLT